MEPFADLLRHFLEQSQSSVGRVARLSGLHPRTIENWVYREVRKPRHWQDVVRVAFALRLTAAETDKLLKSAGWPSIRELEATATQQQDKEMLLVWRFSGANTPFQAIADLPYFVGRVQELTTLTKALLNEGQVAICGLQGMGGVGKTALAAHIAYKLRNQFPDGVLWARLDTSSPMSILSAFAQAYGEDASPFTELQMRSSFVRGILAHKRCLVILDNAQESQQVEPLLPPTTGQCAVLITTRHDLAIIDGWRRLEIGPFKKEENESFALFNKILGIQEAEEEKTFLFEIADILGHLPLAISIAAGRLAHRSDLSAADFLAQLRQDEQRLNALVRENRSVRLTFDLSYASLKDDQQQFLAALSVMGGDDFTIDAVAFITGQSQRITLAYLEELTSRSLVQRGRVTRYKLHPLIRDYAREKIEGVNYQKQMVRYYLSFVTLFAEDHAALDLDLSNILTALDTALAVGMEQAFLEGINTLAPFLEARGAFELAQEKLNQALTLAERHNLLFLIQTLYHLSRAEIKLGQFEAAQKYSEEGLLLTRQAVDTQEELTGFLRNLGAIAGYRGNYEQAEHYLQEGLELAYKSNDSNLIGSFLQNLAVLSGKKGNPEEALHRFEAAYELARHSTKYEQMSHLLASLGVAAWYYGNFVLAEKYLNEALVSARSKNNRWQIVYALNMLGDFHYEMKDWHLARTYLAEALTISQESGMQMMVAWSLFSIAQVEFALTNLTQAKELAQASLVIYNEMKHALAHKVSSWLFDNYPDNP